LSGGTSRAIVLEAPHRFQPTEFPLPKIGDAEFLLRVEKVTICGGDPIEYEGLNRKAHYPLLMGHEVVGRIEQIGDEAARRHRVERGARVMVEPYIACGVCNRCREGHYQFCREGLAYGVTIPCDRPPHLWGAYSEYLYGAPGARIHAIREDVPADAACLTTVIANGVRWVRTRGRGTVGEPILVLGAGAQGLATIVVAKEAGLAPIIVVARSRNPTKLELARRFGADVIIDAESGDIVAQVADALGGRDLGLAVECTGAESMITLAVAALGPLGRLVLAGTRGGRSVPVDIDGVVFKELDVLGGMGQAHDTELAADIVNSRRYPIEEMVTHTFPLEQAEEGLRLFMDGRDGVIHVGLDPGR
jgi:alcohol dehydrogenase